MPPVTPGNKAVTILHVVADQLVKHGLPLGVMRLLRQHFISRYQAGIWERFMEWTSITHDSGMLPNRLPSGKRKL